MQRGNIPDKEPPFELLAENETEKKIKEKKRTRETT
jgi:hypothetical protein